MESEKKPSNFIRDIIDADIAKGKNGDYTVGAGLTARLAIEQGACFAAGPDSPPPVPNCSASGSKVTCR